MLQESSEYLVCSSFVVSHLKRLLFLTLNQGRNSTQILNELEKIRRKQINLATEHISLDGVVDNP